MTTIPTTIPAEVTETPAAGKPRRARRNAAADTVPGAQGLPPEPATPRPPRARRRSGALQLAEVPPPARPPSKLATLVALLSRMEGASLAEMIEATGWQGHSVRGALAGAIRRRGHEVTSGRGEDGIRRYRIGAGA